MMKYEQEFYNNVNRITNMMEEQKKLREDCKVKMFDARIGIEGTPDEIISDFIKDKILVDVKLSETGNSDGHYSRTILVIYKDKK